MLGGKPRSECLHTLDDFKSPKQILWFSKLGYLKKKSKLNLKQSSENK